MRVLKLFLTITVFSLFAYSAVAIAPPVGTVPAVSKDVTPLSKKQQQLAAMKWFVNLTPTEYGNLRGKKLNFFEKASFKLTQYRMKQQLKHASSDDGSGVNWGGLALGFFLGLLGVLGAYIFSSDSNFIKWTWIGLAIWVVLVILIIV
jgi:hypothetical protein